MIVSRTLRTWEEGESGLNERLDPVITPARQPGNPPVAFLASGWEGLKIRLTAKAATHAEAADGARQVGCGSPCGGGRASVRDRRGDDGVDGAVADSAQAG